MDKQNNDKPIYIQMNDNKLIKEENLTIKIRELQKDIFEEVVIQCNQTDLINDLIQKDVKHFSKQNIINLADKDVVEWRLVSPRIYTDLKKRKEVILRNDYGTWWGRTKLGLIRQDEVIQEIAKEWGR